MNKSASPELPGHTFLCTEAEAFKHCCTSEPQVELLNIPAPFPSPRPLGMYILKGRFWCERLRSRELARMEEIKFWRLWRAFFRTIRIIFWLLAIICNWLLFPFCTLIPPFLAAISDLFLAGIEEWHEGYLKRTSSLMGHFHTSVDYIL